jgi:hypothetical protein
MEEVQRSEKRATLEDIMYASVLEKFLELGVDMLGSMDLVQVPSSAAVTPCACAITWLLRIDSRAAHTTAQCSLQPMHVPPSSCVLRFRRRTRKT